MREADGV